MRLKYNDCRRADGNCAVCSLVNYGRDCHDQPIAKLKWYRLASGLTQQQLADSSGVNIRQIRRVELGGSDAGNMTAVNLQAIADVLGVSIRDLIGG